MSISMAFYTELEKRILHYGTTECKQVRKSRFPQDQAGISILDFKAHCKGIVTKTALYWHQNGLINQQNRIENPEIHPCTYSQLIFDKIAKNIH